MCDVGKRAPNNGVHSWLEDTWRGGTTYTVSTKSLDVVAEIVEWFQSLPDATFAFGDKASFGGTIQIEGRTTSFTGRSGWNIKIANLADEYMVEFKLRWML